MNINNTKVEILKAFNDLKKQYQALEAVSIPAQVKILGMKPAQVKAAVGVLVLAVVLLSAFVLLRGRRTAVSGVSEIERLQTETALRQRTSDSLLREIEVYRLAGEAAVQQALASERRLDSLRKQNEIRKSANDKKLYEKVSNNSVAPYDELLERFRSNYDY